MREYRYLKGKCFGPVLLSLVFFIPSVSSAQKFGYGIKGGLNISDISKLLYEVDSKTGLSVYAFGDFYPASYFSVGAQIGYVQRGFNSKPFDYYDFDGAYYYGTITSNLNYVDISVIGKFILNGKVSPYISLGPVLGIKAGTGTSYTGNLIDYSIGEYQSFLNDIYSNSFGIRTGVGMEIGLNKTMSIILESNYYLDLIDSYDIPEVRVGTIFLANNSENVRNSGVEFLVGVKF